MSSGRLFHKVGQAWAKDLSPQKQQNFENNAIFNREPVQRLQNRGDMGALGGQSDNASRSVLKLLELAQQILG